MSDFVVPKPCPSKGLPDVTSVENSSNGRAIATASDKFVFEDLIEDIEIFFEELTAETWLIEKRRSSKQGPLLVCLANTLGFVLSLSNERDPIFLD